VKNERLAVHRDTNIIFERNKFEDVQFDVYRFIKNNNNKKKEEYKQQQQQQKVDSMLVIE
jgi:hypothetical protein